MAGDLPCFGLFLTDGCVLPSPLIERIGASRSPESTTGSVELLGRPEAQVAGSPSLILRRVLQRSQEADAEAATIQRPKPSVDHHISALFTGLKPA